MRGNIMKPISKKIAALGISLTVAITPVLSFNHAEAHVSLPKSFKSLQASTGKAKNQDTEKKFSDNTLVIKYRTPLTAADHQRAGTTVIQQIKELKYIVVKVKNKKNLEAAMKSYQKNNKVTTVNMSPTFKTLAANDPKVDQQYALSMLNVDEAQKLAGKNKVTVAVIDQGIDRNHPELKGSLLPSYNAANPMNPAAPDFHGTHVAGIIAAKKDNGIGGYGMNPNVNLLSIDVFDGQYYSSDYTIAQGILYAIEKGAQVINMSLGGGYPSLVLEEAVKKAIEKGIVVVAASGNDGDDYASYPAAFEGVISVGSTNSSKKLSYYSTYGASVDLVAPGEDIYAPFYDAAKKSTFARLSGTSMATPVVAGAASLLLSKHPSLTPAQVEYILEQTATDMGDSGFDIKYGNGQVNPVAALNYNIKKLPAFVKENWGQKEILEKATSLNADQPISIKESITKPFEQKWIKFSVKKGDYIQTSLLGQAQYDYKMMVHFYGEEKPQIIDVNNEREGKTEAKLIQAPFTGEVAIGVKDSNGSFDDSTKKGANYELKVAKYQELPEDESSLETPIEVAALPFTSKPAYLTGEKGDEDFFHVKADEARLMKIDVSGIPGINIALNVYEKEQLFPPPEETESGETPAPVQDIPSENPAPVEGEEEAIPALYMSNNGGVGEGESLYFMSEPEKEYYVSVTSKKMSYEYSYGEDDFSFVEYGEMEAGQSMLPYTVKMESKLMPEDEDGYSLGGEEEEVTEEDMIAGIDASARPYQIGESAEGYIQSDSDQDWYTFVPEENGIYQFDIPSPKRDLPYVQIAEVAEFIDEETNKTVKYLSSVASNMDYYSWDMELTDTFFAGLKAGKTYYLAAGGTTNFDPYKITSKLAVKSTQDQYEDNDKPEDAKNLPDSGVAEGNFGFANDVDTFYLVPNKTAIYSAKFERQKMPNSLKEYPTELLQPIYAFIQITEDTNGNHKLDPEEADKTIVFMNIIESGVNYGSFKAEKEKKYFIAIQGLVDSSSGISLWPYKFTAVPVNQNDEDAGSKVKNNTPSKPLNLKKAKTKSYSAKGYLNAGVSEGDEDWYVFKAGKKETATIKFAAGDEIDGVIEVYKNGKRVAKSDQYALADPELLSLNLTKGTYYIKVRDVKGNASINPYTLHVNLK